jgi:hypothetical protein
VKDRTILEHYYPDRKRWGIFPDGPICGDRRREVNASRLPSSATSGNSPKETGADSGAHEATGRIAGLPPKGHRGAVLAGPYVGRKSPLPHRMSRSRLTPTRFCVGRATPCKKKTVESAVELFCRVPADEVLRKTGTFQTDETGSLLSRC